MHGSMAPALYGHPAGWVPPSHDGDGNQGTGQAANPYEHVDELETSDAGWWSPKRLTASVPLTLRPPKP